jgi:hypothetical protein
MHVKLCVLAPFTLLAAPTSAGKEFSLSATTALPSAEDGQGEGVQNRGAVPKLLATKCLSPGGAIATVRIQHIDNLKTAAGYPRRRDPEGSA